MIPVTAHEYNELLKAFPTDGLTLIEEQITGISEVNNDPSTGSGTGTGVKNHNYYNLFGQRVSKANGSRIIISNGKKVQQR